MTNVVRERLSKRLFGKKPDLLGADERIVLTGIEQREPITQDPNERLDSASSVGDRLADRVAAVGGSWGFIASFSVILLGWMLLNSDVLKHWGLAFDPYPYIFLNLMLSTLAAIQAPVIMMSQNRQSAKDRLAASLDYQTNLRAELEILVIQEKIDAVIITKLDQILGNLDQREALRDVR